MTWQQEFKQALANIDASAKMIVEEFSEEQMDAVDDLAWRMWHADDPRLGVESIETIVEIAVSIVFSNHVPSPTHALRRTMH
jgi:hypothetical protein